MIKLNSFNTERKRAASSSSRSPDMNCCCCSSSFCNTCSISVIRLSEFKTFYDASLQRKSFVRSRLLTSRPRLDRKAQKLRCNVALMLGAYCQLLGEKRRSAAGDKQKVASVLKSDSSDTNWTRNTPRVTSVRCLKCKRVTPCGPIHYLTVILDDRLKLKLCWFSRNLYKM